MSLSHSTTYPVAAARSLALHAQGLVAPLGAEPPATPEAIAAAVDRIGCVQIDTLHVVQRSHYLVIWSRLGVYDTRDFDGLVYGNATHKGKDDGAIPGAAGRLLFEDWLHAASILPLSEYRYRLPEKRHMRERTFTLNSHRALDEDEGARLYGAVMERIRQDGAVRVADFEYDGPKRGSWWDWKPAKRALENLFAWGDLMIAGRTNFQRLYDLPERVLPDWVDTREPGHDEMLAHMIEEAVRTFGICLPGQVADYDYALRITSSRPVIQRLLAEGRLATVPVAFADGRTEPMLVRPYDLPLLEQAADGALLPLRTTFLSPFDNLFWPRDRDRQFWDFTQRLEAYKPEGQRQWGYFCLSILHRGRFVGRFDPKLDRSTGTLRLKALYLEPGVAPDPELVADVAVAMRSFMVQHAARELVIERSEPPEFGARLLRTL
jgi:uncharacterized protein